MDGPETDEETLDRPVFEGCVFCYSIEMVAYGIDKLRVRPSEE